MTHPTGQAREMWNLLPAAPPRPAGRGEGERETERERKESEYGKDDESIDERGTSSSEDR
jgi:hypothetical protein